METRALAKAIDFENNETLFPGVGHGRMRFCLLTFRKGVPTEAARLFFLARGVADLADQERWFSLSSKDAAAINPNSGTCPVFLSCRDAELARTTYGRLPILRSETEQGSPWGARLHRLFDATIDRDVLRTAEALVAEGWAKRGRTFAKGNTDMLPIIEGKMVTFYDHRAAHIRLNPHAPSRQQQSEDSTDEERSSPDFFPSAYLWAPGEEARERFRQVTAQSWAIAFKRVTSATNWRTMVACVVPESLAISYTLYLVGVGESSRATQHCLLAMLNSFAYDYFVRQKTMQPSLPVGPVYETVMPVPDSFAEPPPWDARVPLRDWIATRVGELVCVSADLLPFARATLGHDLIYGWSPTRRWILQAELDAMAFHHFGFSRADIEHVLGTFPKVHAYDQQAHGEHRTKRVILEIYDSMADAARTGRPYQTRLDPPPADPRVAHAASTRPAFVSEPVQEEVSVNVAQAPAARAWMSRTPIDRQVLILSRVVDAHRKADALSTLGNVKAEKIVHLIEGYVGIDLERQPQREAAGPADFRRLKQVGHRAAKLYAFQMPDTPAGVGGAWLPLSGLNRRVAEYEQLFAERNDIDHLIDLFVPMNTDQAEIVATLFACWNDLLLRGEDPTDAAIVADFYAWSDSKHAFDRGRLDRALAWMRDNGLVPKGRGRPTVVAGSSRRSEARRATRGGKEAS